MFDILFNVHGAKYGNFRGISKGFYLNWAWEIPKLV